MPKPVVEWSLEDVFEWALARVDEKHAQKLHEQEVSGKTLLKWSKQDEKIIIEERLVKMGLPYGPASELASDIKKLSGTPTPTGTPQLQLHLVPISFIPLLTTQESFKSSFLFHQ